MANTEGKVAMKETNPGWKGAKTGTKVKENPNPLGVKVIGRKEPSGAIVGSAKGKMKK